MHVDREVTPGFYINIELVAFLVMRAVVGESAHPPGGAQPKPGEFPAGVELAVERFGGKVADEGDGLLLHGRAP